MDREELIASIRGRVEKCRRLAANILDEAAAKALREMADDGEATIALLEAEPDQSTIR